MRKLVLGAVLLAGIAIGVFLVPITIGTHGGAAKPGSPAFTEPLASNVLLPVPPRFGGVIKDTEPDSKAWWPPTIVPPKGAPNILLVMLDDAGYGSGSTFGGVIPTPTMARLAANGLRYTAFHSCSLCSPTRAALITGRNHHSVHFGMVAEGATGFPGYDAIINKDTATIGEILKQNGYWTSWFGKDHNVAGWMQTQVGPFDQWPIGMGFQYFYGFVGGDSSQWQLASPLGGGGAPSAPMRYRCASGGLHGRYGRLGLPAVVTPCGTRTCRRIKSPLLCRLSYAPVVRASLARARGYGEWCWSRRSAELSLTTSRTFLASVRHGGIGRLPGPCRRPARPRRRWRMRT